MIENENLETPVCFKCGEKMIWTKAKNIDFHYWTCKNKCIFIHPVWEEKLTDNEKKFIKSLN